MSIVFRGFVILSLLLAHSKADTNKTLEDETSYIDKTHRFLSETVIEWSHKLDTMVSNWLDENETNITRADTNNTIGREANSTDNDEINSTAFYDINRTENSETNDSITFAAPSKAKKTNYTAKVPVRRTNVVTALPVNETPLETNVSESALEERVKTADSFFQSEKYLSETDDTYVRVRVENYFQSKGSSDFDMSLRAQVPFRKSRKNLKVFLDNMTLDNAKEILKDEDEAPDIGVNYFKLDKKIHSIYSVGFRGTDPFVKARYNMPIQTDGWLIDLVQSFKYSLDDKFEEETNIYFDKEVGRESLFRVQLYRKTREDLRGMDYALSLLYYRNLSKHTGYGFSQMFFGNTKYEYTVENGIEPPQTKQISGINNYVTSFSWRKQLWRKWFFVEVRPSVNFDKRYDYEPNYRVRFFFDFYLGKFH